MMRVAWVFGAAATGILAASSPAMAQDGAVLAARNAIVGGDLATAERMLVAEQRVFPNSTEVLVNLAAVYAASGRVSEASALYRKVLACEDVLLDINAERTASSHRIAGLGLQRLSRLQTAAR